MKPSAALGLVLAFSLCIGTSKLLAQSSNTDGRSTGGASTMKPAGTGEKIPPHQQPRAADLPKADNNNPIDQLSAEDKALDRKLKGICRGC